MSKRTYALLATLGSLFTLYLAIVGQFGPDPQLSKISLTVSDFAVNDRGGVTDTAMVTFGLSAVALLFSLRPKIFPATLLGVFSLAMLVAAIAPTDPGTELSTVGYVHRYASMTAFIVLPVAGLMITRTRTIRYLCYLSFVLMTAMALSSTFAGRAYIGLIERALLLGELLLLLAVSVGGYLYARGHDEGGWHAGRLRALWKRPGHHSAQLAVTHDVDAKVPAPQLERFMAL